MELKDQVCSLESAKRLKKLGVKQVSVFYWDESDGIEDRLEYSPNQPLLELYAAFTVAELGEMLPDTIGDKTWLQWTKSRNGWNGICESLAYVKWLPENTVGQIFLKDVHKIHNNPYDKAEPKNFTMADSFAKMLIYLLENKLI